MSFASSPRQTIPCVSLNGSHSRRFFRIGGIRQALVFCTLAVAVASVACNSSSTTVAGPTPVKCQVSLASSSGAMEPEGGAGLINVSAQAECAWTASTQATWISDLSPREGQGNAQVQFRAAPNPTAVTRQAEVVVNDHRIGITQAPSPCRFDIAPTQHVAGVAGGTVTVNVTTITGCSWTAASDVSWISVSANAAGNDTGTVSLVIAPNTGPERTGIVRLGGSVVTVAQAGVTPCIYTVTPTSVVVPNAGGSGAVITVATTAECSWSAVTSDPWITVISGGTRQGGGAVSFNVAPNSGNARTGTIAVADRVVTITQSGISPCTYAISPTSQAFDATGGTGTRIAVTTSSACSWTVTSDAAWLTATSAPSGTGNGEVTFSVAPNTGSARTGVLVIGTQRFTVTQAAAPAAPPPPAACTFAINPTSRTIDAGGDPDVRVSVSSQPQCNWTASSAVSWISVTSGAAGTGNGTVAISVSTNTGGERNGTVTIAGQTFAVRQTAAGVPPPPPGPACAYTIAPATASASAAGGAGAPITVTTTSGCSWTASSNDAWLTITSGATGNGPGQVSYNAAANTGAQRTGTLTVAGQTFSVTQAAAAGPEPCVFSITPNTFAASAAGGVGPAVGVSSASHCTWTATSNASWVTITAGATGTGNGTVGFTVAANTSTARSGTLTIAGQTFTVTQGEGCAYSINPTSQSVGAEGGPVSAVSVTAGSSCTWTASSNASWISVTSGATGTGSGTVSLTVAANTSSARTGTVSIAGQVFSVNQAGACAYSIAPTSQSIGAEGGTGSPVAVTAATGCVWSASSNASWITVTSGASGSGSGSVAFSVGANTSAARSGTMSIAGQVFTVNQAAGCTYSIAPTSQSIGVEGGAGTQITVTAAAGCTWTASSNDSWLSVTSGASGSGNGAVAFTVAPNTGASRSGTLTVAGQTFTVSQSGCSYSLSSTKVTIGHGFYSGSVTVTTTAGCSWTATSNASWIHVATSGGTGSGTVTFTVDEIPPPRSQSRTGTITIAGITFTVEQN